MLYALLQDREENIINLTHLSGKEDLCDIFKIENATEFDRCAAIYEATTDALFKH